MIVIVDEVAVPTSHQENALQFSMTILSGKFTWSTFLNWIHRGSQWTTPRWLIIWSKAAWTNELNEQTYSCYHLSCIYSVYDLFLLAFSQWCFEGHANTSQENHEPWSFERLAQIRGAHDSHDKISSAHDSWPNLLPTFPSWIHVIVILRFQ